MTSDTTVTATKIKTQFIIPTAAHCYTNHRNLKPI